MTELAVHARNLSFTYRSRHGDFHALRDVSLAVPIGQSVALLGPNGSGKSTFLRALCGMLRPDDGTIAVFDREDARANRSLLGVVFQSDSLDPHMTVEENLRDHAALHGIPRDEAAQRMHSTLAQAELVDRSGSLVKTLSRGLARRVDLCRALLHQPRILLLDEPTVGLDPSARAVFLTMLEQRRRSENLTVIMSTHLIDEANAQDRVVLLHEGRIVADDTPQSLRRGLGARLVTVHDPSWTPPSGAEQSWRRASDGWAFAVEDDPCAAAALASELAGSGVSYSIAPPTLADVFEQRTSKRLEQQA